MGVTFVKYPFGRPRSHEARQLRGGEAVARAVACTRLEKGRGSCVLGPGSALTLPGSSDSIEKRGRTRRSYNANGTRERGGIKFLWRERLRWGKLRCEGDGLVLTRRAILLFLFFFLPDLGIEEKWERVDIIYIYTIIG